MASSRSVGAHVALSMRAPFSDARSPSVHRTPRDQPVADEHSREHGADPPGVARDPCSTWNTGVTTSSGSASRPVRRADTLPSRRAASPAGRVGVNRPLVRPNAATDAAAMESRTPHAEQAHRTRQTHVVLQLHSMTVPMLMVPHAFARSLGHHQALDREQTMLSILDSTIDGKNRP